MRALGPSVSLWMACMVCYVLTMCVLTSLSSFNVVPFIVVLGPTRCCLIRTVDKDPLRVLADFHYSVGS